MAPGSFTEVPGLGWVWTSFHEFQWDLNYANPAVFRGMLGTMFALANRGIDVLRLDAAPFLWKRMGTDCQNQPEAHLLVQAFRALTRLAACRAWSSRPRRSSARRCWSSTSAGTTGTARNAIWPTTTSSWSCSGRHWRPATCGSPSTRCRAAGPRRADLVGHLRALPRRHRLGGVRRGRRRRGLDGFAHRKFLNDFYAGHFPAPSPGARCSRTTRPPVMPASPAVPRHCAASRARWQPGTTPRSRLAIRRLESMYAVVFSFGGIPLIYMGDELAMRNDPRWHQDPAHATTTGGCTGRRWTGPGRPGAANRTRWKAGVRRDPRPDPRAAGAARPALGRCDRDPADREPQRAGLPPSAPAQRPVPLAHQLQRHHPVGRRRVVIARARGPARAWLTGTPAPVRSAHEPG
jgi:amylosucrase